MEKGDVFEGLRKWEKRVAIHDAIMPQAHREAPRCKLVGSCYGGIVSLYCCGVFSSFVMFGPVGGSRTLI